MFKVWMYDDEELNSTVECGDDEDYAWLMFTTMTAMYMNSEKRKGDHASVVLECTTDDAEFVVARYEQFAK